MMTMAKYLGETLLEGEANPYNDFTPADYAMLYIEKYGQFDGGHHKQWVLDQVARILKGTLVVVKEAKWDNGTINYRIDTAEESPEYTAWVQEMLGEFLTDDDEDGDGYTGYEYGYDVGIAP